MRSPEPSASRPERPAAGSWPYCASLEAQCLAFDLAQRLGIQPLTRLITFATSEDAGARLILQRNRTGFTVQVTNAVEETKETRLQLNDFKELAKIVAGR